MQQRRFIPYNLMDANLVKCFYPLYQVLMFLGCSRISVKDHLVKTPTVWQKLYTFLCISVFTFSFFYFGLYYYTTFYNEDSIMFMACIAGIVVLYTSYFSNIIYTRFCESESAVNLCLLLQEVDKILPLKEFKDMNEQQYYWNLIGVVVIIVTFECGFIAHAMVTVEYPILTVFGGIGLLNVYVEIAFAASLIIFLARRLSFLNKVIEYNFHVKCTIYFKEEPINPIMVNENLIITADSNDTNLLDIEKVLGGLKQLLKSYKLITEIFSFPVLNITTTLFLWVLLITLTVIIGLRAELISTIVMVTVGFWFVYDLILIIILAVVSDYFIQEVRKTKLLCIRAMSCRLEGPIWNGANEILQLIQFYQPTFSVYGIFTLDKKLPLSLISIITTNLVMLIQLTIPNYGQKE